MCATSAPTVNSDTRLTCNVMVLQLESTNAKCATIGQPLQSVFSHTTNTTQWMKSTLQLLRNLYHTSTLPQDLQERLPEKSISHPRHLLLRKNLCLCAICVHFPQPLQMWLRNITSDTSVPVTIHASTALTAVRPVCSWRNMSSFISPYPTRKLP